MLKNARRKLANAISPDKQQQYEFKAHNWASLETQNKWALENYHKMFESDKGRKAINDNEAIEYAKKVIAEAVKRANAE